MKSVLWVSADGLRVVDDKTKVGIVVGKGSVPAPGGLPFTAQKLLALASAGP